MVEVEAKKEIRFHDIHYRKKFKVGCFTFDPIPVQHSVIESLAFAIETPVGTLILTGDFKHDPKRLRRGLKDLRPFGNMEKKAFFC